MEEVPPQVSSQLLNIPYYTTRFAPAQLLFNQKVWNKLPQLASDSKVTRHEVQKTDEEVKAKMKVYADTHGQGQSH